MPLLVSFDAGRSRGLGKRSVAVTSLSAMPKDSDRCIPHGPLLADEPGNRNTACTFEIPAFFPDQQTTFADQRLPPLENYFHYVSLFLIDQSLSLMDGLTWRRLDATLTFPPNARR